MMMVWAWASVPLGVHNIVKGFNIALGGKGFLESFFLVEHFAHAQECVSLLRERSSPAFGAVDAVLGRVTLLDDAGNASAMSLRLQLAESRCHRYSDPRMIRCYSALDGVCHHWRSALSGGRIWDEGDEQYGWFVTRLWSRETSTVCCRIFFYLSVRRAVAAAPSGDVAWPLPFQILFCDADDQEQ
ncbi:hypothetical protein G7046_g9107 [Stylonectria norvegica]|nr:hypothetical protein G7046_g9107 [Stylonectria norvegica]